MDKLKLEYKIRNLFKKWLDYILMSKNVNSVLNIFFTGFWVFLTVYVCINCSRNSQRSEFSPFLTVQHNAQRKLSLSEVYTQGEDESELSRGAEGKLDPFSSNVGSTSVDKKLGWALNPAGEALCWDGAAAWKRHVRQCQRISCQNSLHIKAMNPHDDRLSSFRPVKKRGWTMCPWAFLSQNNV